MLTTDGHFCGDRSGEGVRKEILLSHTSPARNPRHYAHIGRSILLASLTPHHFFTGDQGYAEAILFTEDPQVLGPACAMDHILPAFDGGAPAGVETRRSWDPKARKAQKLAVESIMR